VATPRPIFLGDGGNLLLAGYSQDTKNYPAENSSMISTGTG